MITLKINAEFVKEAALYANLSKNYTSDRHDFHEGGLIAKERKMFEGKLGEKAIKQYFIENHIHFKEDTTSYMVADLFDFLIYTNQGTELKVDVKTRTKLFHTRTLEMVEQISNKPKDIYISVRLSGVDPYYAEIIGYATNEDFLNKSKIENLGYRDNYVLSDGDLRNIETLIPNLQKNGK